MTSSGQKDSAKHQITPNPQNQLQKTLLRTNHPFVIEKIQKCGNSVGKARRSWPTEQHIKYLVFIYFSSDILAARQGKDLWGFFRTMSKFLETKNPNQCRIFHKHMMNKFGNVKEMLKFIQSDEPDFGTIAEAYKKQLKMKTIQQQIKQKSSGKHKKQADIRKQHQPTPEHQKGHESNVKEMPVSMVSDLAQPQKDEKQQNIKTDITIKQAYPRNQNRRPSIDQSVFQAPLESFSWNEPHNIYSSSNMFMAPVWTGLSLTSIDESMRMTDISQRQQEWQECHALYVAWTEKLRALMSYQQ